MTTNKMIQDFAEVAMTTNKMIQDFTYRYNASIRHQSDTRTFRTYSQSYDYYDNSTSTVSIEMPSRSFNHLIEMDNRAEEDYQVLRKEQHLRAKYPAVKDAYEKYQMILALCK